MAMSCQRLLEEDLGRLLKRQARSWPRPQAAQVWPLPRHAEGPWGNGILGNGVRWGGVSEELRDSVQCSRRRRWVQRAPVEIEERLQNAQHSKLLWHKGKLEDKTQEQGAGETRGTAGSLVRFRT